jgi:cation:H+ antiporter
MPDWYLHPPLLLAVFMVLAGFALLIKGADLMVAGAVALARRFGLSPAVIGATVVAFGTSLPELMVSLFSAVAAAREGSLGSADGPAAIAVANVVGSNIFNIGAVLGLSALFAALPVSLSSKRIDYPWCLGSTLLLIGLSLPLTGSPMIVRVEGVILVACLVGYIWANFRSGPGQELPDVEGQSAVSAIGLVALGLMMLAAGGDVTLNGALSVARDGFGLSERVIGLTVMAIGTSLPELVTSVQAARRGQSAMAVANVLGSNCFNTFCIIGVSALVVPLPVSHETLWWDYLWMMGFCLAILPAMLLRGRLSRPNGAVLLVGVLVYVGLLLVLG